MITWTWPNLSCDDIGLSPEGIWSPIHKAHQEGLYKILFSAINFVTLQIEEDGVSSQSNGNMQLKFPFPQKRKLIMSAVSQRQIYQPQPQNLYIILPPRNSMRDRSYHIRHYHLCQLCNI